MLSTVHTAYLGGRSRSHSARPRKPRRSPGAAKLNTLAAWVMWGVVLLLVFAAMAAAGKLAYNPSAGVTAATGPRSWRKLRSPRSLWPPRWRS